MDDMVIALAGNPNVGKSTVFNTLTGSHQHVGNWPGKTVEKKIGEFSVGDQQVTVVDLPGTYSLSAYSIEEEITRDFIVKERPGLVVNVVDASNIERNLYLTAQMLETGIPLIIVLNMQDQAASRGVKIDPAQLSAKLNNTPIIEMVARRGQGIDDLKEVIVAQLAVLTDNGPVQ
jgi:small GTP-binding protein